MLMNLLDSVNGHLFLVSSYQQTQSGLSNWDVTSLAGSHFFPVFWALIYQDPLVVFQSTTALAWCLGKSLHTCITLELANASQDALRGNFAVCQVHSCALSFPSGIFVLKSWLHWISLVPSKSCPFTFCFVQSSFYSCSRGRSGLMQIVPSQLMAQVYPKEVFPEVLTQSIFCLRFVCFPNRDTVP